MAKDINNSIEFHNLSNIQTLQQPSNMISKPNPHISLQGGQSPFGGCPQNSIFKQFKQL